ncbi:hypothetical protein TCON_1136 [Astathelohania contejeani]|uniref:Tetratricopeptide SHNi-TPR domain-containing protein n=1 Tax=Astathelohania contejeani TaxID=164912 RepID=A0ABQ7HZV0_9MICR|nr:hypothetical protein TCON_1136 [Thelohania contejeani]
MNDQNLNSEIEQARVCVNQKQYQMAIDIYSDILNKASALYSVDDPVLAELYLEYANALICNSHELFISELQSILKMKAAALPDKEDDLEIAWNVVELAKNTFMVTKDHYNLYRAYFYLGEILILNNEFSESIKEYANSITELDIVSGNGKDMTYNSQYFEIYSRIASAYEFLKDYQNSSLYYKKCLDLQKNNGSEAVVDELKFRIESLKEKDMELNVGRETEETIENDDKPIIDINSLKKSKMNK